MRRVAIAGFSLIVVLLLGSCMVGPNYRRPEAPVEPDWLEAASTQISNAPLGDPNWWTTAFHDPVLDRLVGLALNQNLSLRSAGLRVLQSQQQLAIAISSLFPQQQQGTGLASRQRESGQTFNSYSLGFNLTWEIDFWGRFRRLVESSSASLGASVAGYDAVLVSLVSQVAQNYILIRTFEARIEVAESNIRLQEESFRIAKAKYDAGEVTQLDVSQAGTVLYNTRGSVQAFQTTLQQLKNTLAVLLGTPPHDMKDLLAGSSSIPVPAPQVALEMPQDLLRRRPDIRIAERQLAAQSAQIGFALTDLYPHLLIGGTISTSAHYTRDLFKSVSEGASLLVKFEWDILNYGRLTSNVRLQDALFQQLLVDYRNTVLQAQGEAENAIVSYLKSHQQLADYRASAKSSRQAVDVASIRYLQGETDFNTLINTLTANTQQDDLLATTQGSVATNLVQVYLALGGGWEIREGRDPVDFLPVEMKDEMRERTPLWKGVLR